MATIFELASRHRIQKVGKGILPCDADPGSDSRALPPDLMEEAARRLGVAALVYAVTYFFAYFVSGLISGIHGGPIELFFLYPRSYVAWVAILFAVGVFFLSRSGRLPPHKVLNGGLGLMVVGSAGIAATTFWGILADGPPDPARDNHFMGVPWEAIWIIICAVIAPNRPRKVLVAALLSASTGLAVAFVSRATGATSADVSYGFLAQYFLFTNYLCALLAWFLSSFVYTLGRHVRQARAVGSYELVERIGAGGMGEVWCAEHRMLARPAAVKLIKQEMLGDGPAGCDEIRIRFEREAQATASLHSAHTIRLYDFGTTADGTFFYAMELLRGISLDELVKKYGPQPAERVVALLIQICHSLFDAHRNDLIHRDIKPGNIMLCHHGQEYDFIKVLDFGLVKSIDPSRPENQSLTQANVTPGTPGFLSPEMALSRPDIDGRADLYSLAGVAYFLLTGAPVFKGSTPLETAAMHLKDQPIPPSKRSEFEIPADLEGIILACLAKDPADRPADARALSEQLADCSVGGSWDWEKATRWWKINDPCRDKPSVAGCT